MAMVKKALNANKSQRGSKTGSIIVGLSGGSDIIYGIRLLEYLKQVQIETHLIVAPAAKTEIVSETDYEPAEVEQLASKVYRFNDIAATISSGSFAVYGMVVIPCSIHALGCIASGVGENLLVRAAEVTIKERRKLIIVPRETPLILIHLQNMTKAAQAGVIVVPAMPAFYQRPKSIDDIANHLVRKVLASIMGIRS
jgi:flavin prenyltransferase